MPSSDWYFWLNKQLKKKGFKVIIPKMPDTDKPEIKEWVAHLRKVIPKPDKNTFFVGHSIGCQTIMRYLEKLPKKFKIGGLVFVAGWLYLENLENEEVKKIAKPWLKTHINLNKIKEKTNNITVFLSTNDPYGCVKENKEGFEKHLKAKVVVEKDKGHFTFDDGITSIPEVLEEIEKFAV